MSDDQITTQQLEEILMKYPKLQLIMKNTPAVRTELINLNLEMVTIGFNEAVRVYERARDRVKQ